jgi:3-dehydroquinate synthase
MQHVHVNLAERSYPIWIGTQTLEQITSHLSQHISGWSHAVIIADAHVCETLAQPIASQLNSAGKRTTQLAVPSGEENKSLERLSILWEQMLAEKTDRKSLVIAIGGGVVGDLAGFAAASFMRGLRFVQVPTTLLAMVDSSVGGKTGINLPAAKNMIGAFWQPHAVWIDTQTLDTLPEREYRSGLAEVVKYGVILDKDFFEYLETHADAILARDADSVQTIVRRSCELKARVVSEDERETTGKRAILNYGHTFGHAIEAKTAYGKFLHGEAISIGMTMAGRLAARKGLWPHDCVSRQSALLQKLGLPIAFDLVPGPLLIEAMQLDKKTEHGKLKFILPTSIGHVQSVDQCSEHDILASIE